MSAASSSAAGGPGPPQAQCPEVGKAGLVGIGRDAKGVEFVYQASSIVDLAKRPELNVRRLLLVVASDPGGEGFKPSTGWCLQLAGSP